MFLELVKCCKTVWTVSTWVRLCISVNTNMILQFNVCLKQLPTVRTVTWSTVAVHRTFMMLQVAGVSEAFVTQWTLVWFLSTVNSAVSNKVSSPCKSFATNSTFKRFLSWTISVKFQRSTFIVWLQQMSLELVKRSKTVWTVSTWVRLCVSVNTNMILQFNVCLKLLPTIWTVIRSSVAVYTMFMTLQVVGLAETFVTQWTLVWFLSTVNSAVSNKVSSQCKSSATNSTFKWFLSWMTSSVCCQEMNTVTTFATFCALVFTSMNIHMITQATLSWKTFLTQITWIQVFSSVSLSVIQMSFLCKPFITHCTQIRPWLVIMWMLSDIINTISFSLHHNAAAYVRTMQNTINLFVHK